MNIAQMIKSNAAKMGLNQPALPRSELPHLPGTLPPDLLEFYSITNGATLLVNDQPFVQWSIFNLDSLRMSDHDLFGGKAAFEFERSQGVCHPLFENTVRLASNGNWHLLLDLHTSRLGRCYATTLEMHFMREDIVVADSFSEWLDRLLATPGDRPYWEAPDFLRISAYS
jgi:hypothetical protein